MAGRKRIVGIAGFGDAVAKTVHPTVRALLIHHTLEQVRDLLRLASQKNEECSEVDRITMAHLADIEAKVSDLSRLAAELRRISECCRGDGLIADCRIIEALSPAPERGQGEVGAGGGT